MNRNDFYSKWKQYQNFVIVGIVSVLMLFFVPMLGSEIGLAWQLPDTVIGWIVYILSKLLVAGLNFLIFHCFILQGKVNAKDNEQHIKANEILRKYTDTKELKPRSPKEYFSGVYGSKGTTLIITTLLAAVGLTQAVLTFDWVSMLTYLVTIVIGLICGVLQMNLTEVYWTEEYYKYAVEVQQLREEEERAKLVEEQSLALAEKEHLEQRDDTSGDTRGTNLLESSDSDGLSSNLC